MAGANESTSPSSDSADTKAYAVGILSTPVPCPIAKQSAARMGALRLLRLLLRLRHLQALHGIYTSYSTRLGTPSKTSFIATVAKMFAPARLMGVKGILWTGPEQAGAPQGTQFPVLSAPRRTRLPVLKARLKDSGFLF